jgi:hypothetical protein
MRRYSTGVLFEVVKRKLRILANLDEVNFIITHVAPTLPTVIV